VQTSRATWYVQDAQGNVMDTYDDLRGANNTAMIWLKEQTLYGSSRLGNYEPSRKVYPRPLDQVPHVYQPGLKRYKPTNHLGNVLTTVSDLKQAVDASTPPDGVVDFERAVVKTQQSYYPFGMLQPGMSYAIGGSKYRYGFNGQENDNEVKGTGNQQDYWMRIYDPRLGKFLSVDPLFKSYPWYTPYQYAGNRPTIVMDLDGLEELIMIRWFDQGKYTGTTIFRVDNIGQREIGKRGNDDMQMIELDESLRTQFNPNSKNIQSISSLVKNSDGTFKGEYRTSLLNSEKVALGSLRKLDIEINNGVSKKIDQDIYNVFYEYDKSNFLSEENLELIITSLNTDPERKIVVHAYASSEGDAEYNQDLSQNRANAITRYLISEGIDSNRILSPVGAGETDQWGDNNTEATRAPNRRAQISVTYEKTQE